MWNMDNSTQYQSDHVQHEAARERHSGGPSTATNTPSINKADGKNDDDDMDLCAEEQGNEVQPYAMPWTALPQYASHDGGRERGRDVLGKGRERSRSPIRSRMNNAPGVFERMMRDRELRASLRFTPRDHLSYPEVQLSSITPEDFFRQAMQHEPTAERMLRGLQDSRR